MEVNLARNRPDKSGAKRVVILTGSERRHDFLRQAIAITDGIQVARTYCEGLEKSLQTFIDSNAPDAELQRCHLAARDNSEQDFFGAFVALVPDRSNPVFLPKGAINQLGPTEEIRALNPDLLIAYGCSIIREPLLSLFQGRFLNVHLGLSPYYRGSGTNFWPLVNEEPEFVGATFMHIDAGVDTGEIIHQIRARIRPGDTPHQIGNRLIADVAASYIRIIRDFERLAPPGRLPEPLHPRYYRKKDFTPESVKSLYAAFAGGLIDRYLREAPERQAKSPVFVNALYQT